MHEDLMTDMEKETGNQEGLPLLFRYLDKRPPLTSYQLSNVNQQTKTSVHEIRGQTIPDRNDRSFTIP